MADLKKEINFSKGCEECGIVEELFDTITDGKPIRLCRRCAQLNGSFILVKKEEGPAKIILEKMKVKPKENFSLNDLYERYRERRAKEAEEKQKIMHEQEFLEDLEKEQARDIEEIKKAVEAEESEFNFNLEENKKFSVRDFFNRAFEKIRGKKNREGLVEEAKEEISGKVLKV
ncbi:MAG: hypothetical protein QXP53_02130 [Candidatus Pacearchaeota archaeon]